MRQPTGGELARNVNNDQPQDCEGRPRCPRWSSGRRPCVFDSWHPSNRVRTHFRGNIRTRSLRSLHELTEATGGPIFGPFLPFCMRNYLTLGLVLGALVIIALGFTDLFTAQRLALFSAMIILTIAVVDLLYPDTSTVKAE